jgi:hypothetical protein
MKKLLMLLIVLLIGTALFGYQNDQGVGIEAYLDWDSDSTGHDTEIDARIFYTFMRMNNVMEIAPYFELDVFKEVDNTDTTTDGYFDWGFGSMAYWHFVDTRVISLSTGLDAGFMIGKWNEDIYGSNSHFEIGVFAPFVLDINLGRTLVVRISQNIAGVYYTSSEFAGPATTSFTIWTIDSFNPRFGFLVTF